MPVRKKTKTYRMGGGRMKSKMMRRGGGPMKTKGYKAGGKSGMKTKGYKAGGKGGMTLAQVSEAAKKKGYKFVKVNIHITTKSIMESFFMRWQ